MIPLYVVVIIVMCLRYPNGFGGKKYTFLSLYAVQLICPNRMRDTVFHSDSTTKKYSFE